MSLKPALVCRFVCFLITWNSPVLITPASDIPSETGFICNHHDFLRSKVMREKVLFVLVCAGVFVGQQPSPGLIPQATNYLGFVRLGLSLTWNTLISLQASEVCLHSPRGGIGSAYHHVQVVFVCLFVCRSSQLHSKHLTNRTISSAQEQVLKGKLKLLEFEATKLESSCGLQCSGYQKQSSHLSSGSRPSANHVACLTAPSLFRAHRLASLFSYSLFSSAAKDGTVTPHLPSPTSK